MLSVTMQSGTCEVCLPPFTRRLSLWTKHDTLSNSYFLSAANMTTYPTSSLADCRFLRIRDLFWLDSLCCVFVLLAFFTASGFGADACFCFLCPLDARSAAASVMRVCSGAPLFMLACIEVNFVWMRLAPPI